jgi:O-antigen ligase
LERLQSIEALASDPSLTERVAQYSAAWQLFLSSPVIGVGPGHSIEWTNVSGISRREFTADTPLVLPAKFGVVGTIVVLLLVIAYLRLAVRRGRREGWNAGQLALLGYGVFAVVSLPLGMPLEDKAFSFGLTALVAFALIEARAVRSDEERHA